MSSLIYHMVPDNMQGEILYPLNVLRQIHPEGYAFHAAKYKGREWLPKTTIPIFDCFWNDVLFCTPVHPGKVYSKLREVGYKYPLERFYEIPFNDLEPERCAVMEYANGGKDKVYNKVIPSDLSAFDKLPEETIQYYVECYSKGAHPMLFAWVPHIIYRGSINTHKLNIIEV
jgi:hypothetical protein